MDDNKKMPFYVDIGESWVSVRCSSSNEVLLSYLLNGKVNWVNEAKRICEMINKEAQRFAMNEHIAVAYC